jgi:hypothetical protein
MSTVAYPFTVLQIQASVTAVSVSSVDVSALQVALSNAMTETMNQFCKRPEITTGRVVVQITEAGALVGAQEA